MLGLLCLSQIGSRQRRRCYGRSRAPSSTGTSAAAGIAAINALGNLSGFAGPYMMGYLRDATGNFTAGLLLLGGCALVGGIVAMTLRVSTHLETAATRSEALAH